MSRLEAYARSLTPAAEFWIVVAVAFSLPILGSLSANLSGQSYADLQFTDADLHAVVAMEAMVLLPIAWFLGVRGWSIAGFGPWPSGQELVHAIGLALAAYVLMALPWLALQPSVVTATSAPDLSVISKLAVAIINPLFEELLLCAYVIPAVAATRGLPAGIAASLAIRLSFHTYQGVPGLIAIGLLGLLVSIYYVRTGRLWPPILAHGALDFIGL